MVDINSILNLFFILLIFVTLVALDYAYTIGDDLIGGLNDELHDGGFSNAISTAAVTSYANVRSLMYSVITGVLTPFLLMLTFGSSFVNRNQDIVMYFVQVIGIVFMTPLAIYLFANMFTSLLSVTILDSAYMATAYFDNFLLILVLNMLFGIASFVFVQRSVVREY